MTNTTQAVPEISTQFLTPGQRALGRMIDLDTQGLEDPAATETDLLAESFWSYYGNPEAKEEVPQERIINRRLLDWVKKSPSWEKNHVGSMGSLMKSIFSSQILTHQLLNDPEVKKAMDEQKKAEEAQKAAEEAREKADAEREAASEAMNFGDEKAANEHAQKAAKLQGEAVKNAQKAAEAIAKANAQMDKVEGNTKSQITRAGAIDKAKKGAEEAADFAEGWGMGDGANSPAEVGEMIDTLKNNKDMLEIAKLIGRIKGISLAHKAKNPTKSEIIVKDGYTRIIPNIFPSEAAMLSNDAPSFMRIEKTIQYLDRGLLGMVTGKQGKAEGKLVVAIDDSGSMGSKLFNTQRTIIARALAIGLAQSAKETDQKFSIFSFASNGLFPTVTDENEPKEIMDWAKVFNGGGTDMDEAIIKAIETIDGSDDAENADIVIVSDGDARVNNTTCARYTDLKNRYGTRLIFVQIGSSAVSGIEKIETAHIQVDENNTLDKLGNQIAEVLEK